MGAGGIATGALGASRAAPRDSVPCEADAPGSGGAFPLPRRGGIARRRDRAGVLARVPAGGAFGPLSTDGAAAPGWVEDAASRFSERSGLRRSAGRVARRVSPEGGRFLLVFLRAIFDFRSHRFGRRYSALDHARQSIRWSSTPRTPGTVSAATRMASRSACERANPHRCTTESTTTTFRYVPTHHGCVRRAANTRSRIARSSATPAGWSHPHHVRRHHVSSLHRTPPSALSPDDARGRYGSRRLTVPTPSFPRPSVEGSQAPHLGHACRSVRARPSRRLVRGTRR
jgi:hypothetical protein